MATKGHTVPADSLEVHSDGAVHAHIMPVKLYIAIFLALIMFTLLTVGVASIHLGQWNLVVAIVIASAKASLVLGFFMHLKYDNKFNAMIVVLSIMFIGIFFAYTLNDTEHRGEIDLEQGVRVLPSTGSAAPGGPPVPAPTATEKSATGEMTPKPTAVEPGTGATNTNGGGAK